MQPDDTRDAWRVVALLAKALFFVHRHAQVFHMLSNLLMRSITDVRNCGKLVYGLCGKK